MKLENYIIFSSMIYDSGHITYKSFSIYYKTVGTGPVVLLIHGYGYNHHLWDNILPELADYKVILIELPGFGSSKKTKKYTLCALARGIMKWLEEEGIEQYFLLGHSMGGYLGMEFLAKKPKRLMGFGLIHSSPFGDDSKTKKLRKTRVTDIKKNGLDAYLEAFYKNLMAPTFANEHEALIQEQLETGKSYGKTPFIAGMNAMRKRKDRSKKLAQFEKPVLFIVGELDAAIPRQTSLKQLSIPHIADIHILSGVGHMGMLEAPQKFNKAIINYLDSAIKINDQTGG